MAIRQHLAHVCEQFIQRDIADPKFVSELLTGSKEKFWSSMSEALLAHALCHKTFLKREKRGKGPDFLVLADDRRVWIEVVCPTPSGVPSDWLYPQFGKAVDFPHEELLLRWTSAIKAKAESLVGSADGKVKGYLNTGEVAPEDVYVIAVNGCQLRSGPFPALTGITQVPFAAEAVFPIGPYYLQIDRESLKVLAKGHQCRPYIMNSNGSSIPALTFLDPKFNAVSAIWAVDINGGVSMGASEAMAVIHNPNATNPLPYAFLPADQEYLAIADSDDVVLRKLVPEVRDQSD